MLAKRLEEAKVAEVMVPNEVQIVDAATLPEKPVKPRKALTMMLALLLGILCGTGCTVVRSLLNRKINTADDVEQYLQLPVLGMIPDANSISKEYQNRDRSIRKWMERIRQTIWKK
jgi:capsular polysaccharide biosynthesis protein